MNELRAATRELPGVKTLLVCERTIREADTNKVTIVGIFEGVTSQTFPITFPSVGIFAEMERGLAPTEVFYFGLTAPGDRLVWTGVCQVQDWNDAGRCDYAMNAQSIAFPVPGVYMLRVYVDVAGEKRAIAEREVVAHQLNE